MFGHCTTSKLTVRYLSGSMLQKLSNTEVLFFVDVCPIYINARTSPKWSVVENAI